MTKSLFHGSGGRGRPIAALFASGLLSLTGCGTATAPEEEVVPPAIESIGSALDADEPVLFGNPGTGPLSARAAPTVVRPMTAEEYQFLTAEKARIPSSITPAVAKWA